MQIRWGSATVMEGYLLAPIGAQALGWLYPLLCSNAMDITRVEQAGTAAAHLLRF